MSYYYDDHVRARAQVLAGQGRGRNNIIIARTGRYIQSDSPAMLNIVFLELL